MKKFSFYATLIFLMTFMLTACETESGKKDSSTGKVSIVTTIYPQYDWIKNILGEYSDKVDLKLLIKNGTDLHSYKTSAQDIAAIAKADMVVYVGGESDDWIKKALEATPKAGRIQVNLMDVLGDRVKEEEIVEGMEHEHGEEEHHEHAEEHEHEHHEHAEAPENDEHIWLSLKNAQILVKSLAESVAKIDTANAPVYRANAILYASKLHDLDWAYDSTVSYASQKTVLFGDRFPFRYLVDDYGIKYYAAFVGCSAESEASFETIAFLAGKMDSESLPSIFIIENGNDKIAKAVLAASKKSQDAQILTINSMQSITEKQINDGINYISLMKANLENLKKALN